MSTATLERDLDQYLANSGYSVEFEPAIYLVVYVRFNGREIARKPYMMFKWRKYQRGARWALRTIEEHKRGMRVIAGITVAHR